MKMALKGKPKHVVVIIFEISFLYILYTGGAVIEGLGYKPGGRGIDSRRYHWNFSLT
jgi:hypothetical protein